MPATTQDQLDQILRRLPERYAASEAVLSGAAAQLALSLNAASDLQATGFFEGADAQWLTLHAAGYGLSRSTDEPDPSLRGRLRNIGAAVTRPAILAAVDALLVARGSAVPAVMIEHQDSGTVLDTTDLPYSFIIGVSYIVGGPNAFLLVVPDFGDPTDPVYAAILSEVNRLRAAGIRWALTAVGPP